MFGPPEDVAGECNVRLEIGDDYGDNSATMRCQRESGHEGRHREEYEHDGAGKKVIVEWD